MNKKQSKADTPYRGVLFFDNGTTGTIGFICGNLVHAMIEVPTKKRESFHKAPRSTTVIDVNALEQALQFWMKQGKVMPNDIIAYRERPMINPKRWQASMSASRADEAETILLEKLGIKFQYVDSKAWQRHILPSSGKRGTTSDILKAESKDIGIKMYKHLSSIIEKHGDADGILGAFVFDQINDNLFSGMPNWKIEYIRPCEWKVIDPDEENQDEEKGGGNDDN